MALTTKTEQPQQAAPENAEPAAEQGLLDKILERHLVKINRIQGEIRLTPEGVDFPHFEGVWRYARMLCAAGCVPWLKDDTENSQISRAAMCILLGRKVGLSPEQSVCDIYIVNARPTIFGDAPLALARQHQLWDESGFEEYFEVGGKRVDGIPDMDAFKADSTAAICKTLRKGAKTPRLSRFSMSHAKASNLMKNAVWTLYPYRMLMFRARGYCIRDNFGDALKGFGIKELYDDEPAPDALATPLPVGMVDLLTVAADKPAPAQEIFISQAAQVAAQAAVQEAVSKSEKKKTKKYDADKAAALEVFERSIQDAQEWEVLDSRGQKLRQMYEEYGCERITDLTLDQVLDITDKINTLIGDAKGQ